MTDDELTELWHERAAIMEYDGGRSRENANKVAAIWIKRTFGKLPDAVRDAIRDNKKDA